MPPGTSRPALALPTAGAGPPSRPPEAEAERVVAWLRLPAIALFALGGSLTHPYAQQTAFLVALAAFSSWSAGVLAWVYLRPVGKRLPPVTAVADIVAIGVLAALSGGAFSHVRLAFFLVPVAVAFRIRPRITAAAAAAATAAYVVLAVAHPARSQPEAARFIATQAGFIAWVGAGCTLLSLLLARRTGLASGLAQERSHLLADALEAEQRERKALAESLHDHALQNLLSARQELAEVGERLDDPSIGRVAVMLADTVRQLRDTVFELHPYVLEQAGLAAALRSLARQVATRAGLDLRLDLGHARSHAREQLLFSAARELLSNVARHAHATHLTVRLGETDGELELAVEDDGKGFPPERLPEQLAAGHVGLASQRVRIEAAGGGVEIASAPGRGTRVRIRLPLEQ